MAGIPCDSQVFDAADLGPDYELSWPGRASFSSPETAARLSDWDPDIYHSLVEVMHVSLPAHVIATGTGGMSAAGTTATSLRGAADGGCC